MQTYDTTSIIVGMLSILGAIFCACITYLCTKRMQFFETYFEKRAKAYEELMVSLYQFSIMMISHHYNCADDKEFNAITQRALAAISSATLYCSEQALDDIQKWGKRLELFTCREVVPDIDAALSKTQKLLRNDIILCQKYKFK